MRRAENPRRPRRDAQGRVHGADGDLAPGGGGTFLSPAQLLVLATAWRLPVNEVTFVPWAIAAPVEEALHAARWTMSDADASALLGEYAAQGGVRQGFLTHGDTQGDVLEGFVLMALDASPELSLIHI